MTVLSYNAPLTTSLFMNQNAKKFGEMVKTAIRRIAISEKKNISLVQDELGFAIGRDSGGESIRYWERGHIPSKDDETNQLIQWLSQKQGLNSQELSKCYAYAGLLQANLSTRNTFLAGRPVTHPRHFFGRTYELTRLFDLWKYEDMPMQNAAIIGPRRVGKTSLLMYLQRIMSTAESELRPDQPHEWLPPHRTCQWVYADFADPRLGTRQGFLTYLLTQLGFPVPDPCDLLSFVEVVSRHLTQPTVILLDELGKALTRYDELDDRFWDGLRALASTQVDGKLGFVLSVRESPHILSQRHGRSSDFFTIFAYTARLGPLTESEARELMASSSMPFSESDIRWILRESGCWPMLVQLLSHERLITLRQGDASEMWRDEGLRQLEPYTYLLERA